MVSSKYKRVPFDITEVLSKNKVPMRESKGSGFLRISEREAMSRIHR